MLDCASLIGTPRSATLPDHETPVLDAARTGRRAKHTGNSPQDNPAQYPPPHSVLGDYDPLSEHANKNTPPL